jgi:hypothetical protein
MRDGEILSDERTRRPPPRTAQEGTASAEATGGDPPAVLAREAVMSSGSFWSFGSMITAAAVQALARKKMRSALTMLGVFIAVAALIAMVAVGQGANDAVRKQIESLGTNLMVVVPGAARMGGRRVGKRVDPHGR